MRNPLRREAQPDLQTPSRAQRAARTSTLARRVSSHDGQAVSDPIEVIAAARQLHDAIGCFYGDFTEADSEHGPEVYAAALQFIAAYEKP